MMPVVSIDTATGWTTRYEHVGKGRLKKAGAIEWIIGEQRCAKIDQEILELFRQRGMDVIPE